MLGREPLLDLPVVLEAALRVDGDHLARAAACPYEPDRRPSRETVPASDEQTTSPSSQIA